MMTILHLLDGFTWGLVLAAGAIAGLYGLRLAFGWIIYKIGWSK